MEDAIAGCFFTYGEKNREEWEIAIPFYILQDTTPSLRVFSLSHEQLHIARRYRINQVYQDLKKRLEKHGYRIEFSDFNVEEQADIGGITALMENNLSLEPVFRRCKSVREIYQKMQKYYISQANFWKEDLSSALSQQPGLYKPGRTNK